MPNLEGLGTLIYKFDFEQPANSTNHPLLVFYDDQQDSWPEVFAFLIQPFTATSFTNPN
jgi:hypothetical protein